MIESLGPGAAGFQTFRGKASQGNGSTECAAFMTVDVVP
jgi:hypothetical protein